MRVGTMRALLPCSLAVVLRLFSAAVTAGAMALVAATGCQSASGDGATSRDPAESPASDPGTDADGNEDDASFAADAAGPSGETDDASARSGSATDAVATDARASDSGGAPGFVHPGLLTTRADLVGIKSALGQAPYSGALAALKATPYGSLSYAPKPYATVECGSYNHPAVGCTQMVADGMAAYVQALLWWFTGDPARSALAEKILDGWAATWQSNTDSNAPLVVAWAAPWYVNAAELLSHMGAGWSPTAVATFKDFARRLLPYTAGQNPSNNWLTSKIEAEMAIAIFLDDTAAFHDSVARWVPAVESYYYLSSDGPTPKVLPGDSLSPWKTAHYVAGQCMETCRDFGHTILGWSSVVYGARMAWSQGVDLFRAEDERLAAFMELHASWTTGQVAVPSSICDGNGVLCDGQPGSPHMPCGLAGWEIAIDQLGDRLGMSLPQSRAMLTRARPVGPAVWNRKPETILHGLF